MDIFDQARDKASIHLFEELNLQGYQEIRHPLGSLFHTVRQNGLPNKAIIITVHIEPNISSEYKFRRMDSLEFQDFQEKNYDIYCYHYSFNDALDDYTLEEKQVGSAYDILEFWDAHKVTYETEKIDGEDEVEEAVEDDETGKIDEDNEADESK